MAESVVCASHNRLMCGLVEANGMDTIYFLLAVAATSGAIFALMMRADRVKRGRRSSDGGSSDPSVNDSAVRSWFGPYGGGRNDW
jgi:hypothetical protein